MSSEQPDKHGSHPEPEPEQTSGAGIPPQSDAAASPSSPAIHHSPALQKYWRRNILVMSALLGIWALAGLGCGILLADYLNQFRLFGTGYPLGFWFAQQGSIIVFVLVILAYCIIMNYLDKVHKKEREEETRRRKEGGQATTEGGAA
jgi:putative solute:sodium symporter small subunit